VERIDFFGTWKTYSLTRAIDPVGLSSGASPSSEIDCAAKRAFMYLEKISPQLGHTSAPAASPAARSCAHLGHVLYMAGRL